MTGLWIIINHCLGTQWNWMKEEKRGEREILKKERIGKVWIVFWIFSSFLTSHPFSEWNILLSFLFVYFPMEKTSKNQSVNHFLLFCSWLLLLFLYLLLFYCRRHFLLCHGHSFLCPCRTLSVPLFLFFFNSFLRSVAFCLNVFVA